jgi:hypothetical protein
MELPLGIASDPLEASVILPLGVPLELPIDIWRVIALLDPAVYNILVRTTKKIHYNNAMAHFTTRWAYDKCKEFPNILAYRLPNGLLHSPDNDTPSVDDRNIGKWWYYAGQLHRDGDLPALRLPRGCQQWFQHGECHRDGDRPAVIYSNGERQWYLHGKIYKRG